MSEDKNKGENTQTSGSSEPKERKLKVEVSRDPEIEALNAELAKLRAEYDKEKEERESEKEKFETDKNELSDKVTTYEAEKAQSALEQFEKDKKDIIDVCKTSGLKEEQIKEINDKLKTPQQLETVKQMVNMLITVIPKKEDKALESPAPAPAGKATISTPELPSTDGTQSTDSRKIVDDIYEIINDRSNKYTAGQKKEANDKRMKLWNSLFQGKAWDQMKKGASMYKSHVIMNCPQCGSAIHGEGMLPERCQNCGFDLTKTGDRYPVGAGPL
jgi:rubrerythrin